MWPWIKRWRDWAMHDLWPMHRIGPQPQALHYSYEKAGLTLHDQAIPWNAEVVVVEAQLRLQSPAQRRKAEYHLHLPGLDPVPAEALRRQETDDIYRVFFRVPPPAQTVAAEFRFRGRLLGELTLPVLTRDEFLKNLRLQMPTLFARIGDQSVACQTYVSTQCKGLMASALLTSPTSLVPLLDLGLQVEFRSERGGPVHIVHAQLSSSQLADRQALVMVVPRRFPRRIGTWLATWVLADQPLATQRIRAISQRHFQKSLRVSDTRFVVRSARDEVTLARQLPPLSELSQAGPCFLVSSREAGMAGLCQLQVHVQVPGSVQAPVLRDQEVLITDGPTMVAPGTLEVGELEQVTAFELRLRNETLGVLSLSPVPVATFTGEGGFKPTHDFAWSAAADEELNDRLSRLLEGNGK